MDIRELKLFIDGRYCDASDGGTFDSINPADKKAVARVAKGTAADVNRAIQCAERAFREWSVMPAEKRGGILRTAADLLRKRAEEFAKWETLDVGKPISDTRNLDLPVSIRFLEYYAGALRTAHLV